MIPAQRTLIGVRMLRKENKWGKGFEQMYIFAYQGRGRWGIYNLLLKHILFECY